MPFYQGENALVPLPEFLLMVTTALINYILYLHLNHDRCSSPYSGDRCEITDVWSPIVIAMVATAGVLSIVLIALFFACCFFLGKRLDEKEPKCPGIYDIEQRDSYNSSLPSKKQSRSSNAPPSQPSGRRIQTSFATSVDLDAGNYRQNVSLAEPDLMALLTIYKESALAKQGILCLCQAYFTS